MVVAQGGRLPWHRLSQTCDCKCWRTLVPVLARTLLVGRTMSGASGTPGVGRWTVLSLLFGGAIACSSSSGSSMNAADGSTTSTGGSASSSGTGGSASSSGTGGSAGSLWSGGAAGASGGNAGSASPGGTAGTGGHAVCLVCGGAFGAGGK